MGQRSPGRIIRAQQPAMSPEAYLARLQDTLFEMLVVLDRFFRRHSLRYFLDSGTALGAVRHGGFIPWDDDLDLGMLREDYDRFLQVVADEGLPPGYSLHTFQNTPGYAPFFAKVYLDGTVYATQETISAGCDQGIFVDIFPYDALAADGKERCRQIAETDRWCKASYLYHAGGDVVLPYAGVRKAVVKQACAVARRLLRATIPREKLEGRFNEALHINGRASTQVACFYGPPRRPFPEAVLKSTQEMTFKGRLFPVPADYDRYLETLYGPDWRELPPEGERRTHAPFVLDFGITDTSSDMA